VTKIKTDNTDLNNHRKDHFQKVGERIKELRLTAGLGILKFEEMVGLPSGTMHNLEKGKGGSAINIITILTHFSSLGYSLKWMLEYDNDVHFKEDEQHIYLDIDKNRLLEISEELAESVGKLKKVVSKYK
jgi:transcriptional regulator with XRE-family HTH domain